jgi:hypothetical protein
MKIDYYVFIIKIYDLGLSFLPLYMATLTSLKWTSGISPTAPFNQIQQPELYHFLQ